MQSCSSSFLSLIDVFKNFAVYFENFRKIFHQTTLQIIKYQYIWSVDIKIIFCKFAYCKCILIHSNVVTRVRKKGTKKSNVGNILCFQEEDIYFGMLPISHRDVKKFQFCGLEEVFSMLSPNLPPFYLFIPFLLIPDGLWQNSPKIGSLSVR